MSNFNSTQTGYPCKIMFTTLQDPKNLCYIDVAVDFHEKRDSSAKSCFQWRILKCRQLIFSDPQIIASPALGKENQIYVVMNSVYYGNGSFNKLLEKLKLLVILTEFIIIENKSLERTEPNTHTLANEPKPVSNSIYESCLRYTIIARIAPHWNQLGDYLVHSRDFLVCDKPLNAVKLQICINDVNLLIILWPLRIKLLSTNVDDLDTSTRISQSFEKNSISTISERNMRTQLVYVLPSLRKGHLVHVNNKIPATCPYKTYKELRRHWKNMYGYRLPEEDNSKPYCTIMFHPMNPTLYTYPSVCIRTQNINILRPVNEKDILKCFHDDLLRKIPTVCGHTYFINRNLLYAVPKLNSLQGDSSSNSVLFCFPNLGVSDMNDIEPVIADAPASHSGLKNSLTQDDIFASNTSETDCSSKISFMTTLSESVELPIEDLDNIHSPVQSLCTSDVDQSQKLRNFLLLSSTNVRDNCQKRKTYVKEHTVDLKIKHYLPENYVDSRAMNIETDLSLQHEINDSQCSKNFFTFSKQDYVKDAGKVSSEGFSLPKVQCNSEDKKWKTAIIAPPESRGHRENVKRNCPYQAQQNKVPTKRLPSYCQSNQEVDVEQMAKDNNLQKVQVPVLTRWLKNKLVPCSSKDKKAELITKVKQYLSLTLQEK